jgi:hypothetical protein
VGSDGRAHDAHRSVHGAVPVVEVLNLGLVVSLTGVPLAAGVAILKYRLYEIDTIINRTLVYSVLTALLALLYVGSVVLLQMLFSAPSGGDSQLAVLVSTLAIAARCSILCGVASRRWTDASTAASTTRWRRWKPSPPPCATRRIWLL